MIKDFRAQKQRSRYNALMMTLKTNFHLKRHLALALTLAIMFLAVACTPRGLSPQDIPTQASLSELATSLPLTQNAPPTPFNLPQTGFSAVDNNLKDLPGWRYVVQLNFEGVFSGTPRTANASAQAEISFNQLASARHIIVSTSGALLGQDQNTNYEAVQLGPDNFLVSAGACYRDTDAAKTAADLQAGQLVGGVKNAVPGGRHATINSEDVYYYTFEQDDLVLPELRAGDNGKIQLDSGELWISPSHNAVVRFYLNLDVDNVVIFDQQLPVTGQIQIRYDLYDIGNAFNITTPFGC